jgi:hypothetical protein
VRPLDVVPGYLVPDGQPSQVMSPRLAPAGPIFPGPNPIQVWVQASVGDRPDMTLVDLRDYQPVTTVTLPAESSPVQAFGDGAGYLVSPGVGGFYDARPDGLHLITAGELLAVGPTGWLATECDHRHRCTTVSIDRATGTRRVVAAAGAVSSGPPGVISPDGATAALLLGGSPGAIAVELIDLATGHRRHVDLTLDDAVLDATMVWSPDSRWLFTIGAGGTLRAIDRGTGGVRSLGVSLPGLSQLALRNRLR